MSDNEEERFCTAGTGDNKHVLLFMEGESKWSSFRDRGNIRRLASLLLLLFGVVSISVLMMQSHNHYRQCCVISNPNSFPRLSYRQQGSSSNLSMVVSTFTIMQLADLHLGEEQNTTWGPQQDAKTFHALSVYLESSSLVAHQEVDLIVLSGDQLTNNNCYSSNATVYYQQLLDMLSPYSIPVAVIFGNHDDMPADHRPGFSATSRLELMAVLKQYPLSVTQTGPDHVTGVSNYWLNIYNTPFGGNGLDPEVASRIVFFDTGGGLLPQVVDDSHLQWFHEHNDHNRQVPVVAFAHIPLKEFGYINGDNHAQQRCVGHNDDGGVAVPRDGDAGLVSTLAAAGNVHFLAVGHNHGNDYCCPYHDSNTSSSLFAEQNDPHPVMLSLCFGRHSGYGGYGTWDRGVRLYQMQLSSDNVSSSSFQWKSWVYMESGVIQDEYDHYENNKNLNKK